MLFNIAPFSKNKCNQVRQIMPFQWPDVVSVHRERAFGVRRVAECGACTQGRAFGVREVAEDVACTQGRAFGVRRGVWCVG